MQWGVMLGRSTVIESILMSLTLTLVAATLAALIWRPPAYAFARLRFPGRQVLLFSFIATHAVPKFTPVRFHHVVFLRLGLIGNFWGVWFWCRCRCPCCS